jgi:hypothetical protein
LLQGLNVSEQLRVAETALELVRKQQSTLAEMKRSDSLEQPI